MNKYNRFFYKFKKQIYRRKFALPPFFQGTKLGEGPFYVRS